MEEQKLLQSKNFLNNQNYVKYENADEKFYKYKISIYTFYIVAFSILFSLIAYNILNFSNFINNIAHFSLSPTIIFKQNENYYYFSKINVFFFISLSILFIIISFMQYFLFKKLDRGYFNKSGTKKGFYIPKIYLVIFIILFYIFTPSLSEKFFIIGFLMLFIPSIVQLYQFSKSKIYIKKPFNIKHFYYIHPKNLIIKNLHNPNKSMLIFTPIGFFIVYSILTLSIFYNSIIKKFNQDNLINRFVSINLDDFVTNKKLNLAYKQIGYKDMKYIFEYVEKNKIKKLDIKNNNFNNLNILSYYGWDFIPYKYKLDEIDLGNIYDYKDFNFSKFKKDFDNIKQYLANKIVLRFNKSGNNYSLTRKNELKRLYYNLSENKINNDIKIEFKEKIIEGLGSYENNLLKILNKQSLFKSFKGKIILSNVLLPNDTLSLKRTSLSFIKKINNKFVMTTGYGSEYINKYLSLKFKGIYKKDLKSNSVQLVIDKNIISYKNRFIPAVILENLILNYKNTSKLILENIDSKDINIKSKNAFIITPNIKVKNLVLTKGTKFQIWFKDKKDIENTLNILTDDFDVTTNTGNSYNILSDIQISGSLKPKISTQKKILFKNPNIKYGYYKFDKYFLDGGYKNNVNNIHLINYLYENYYNYLFNNKNIAKKVLEETWNKYQTDTKFKKMFNLFISTNKEYLFDTNFDLQKDFKYTFKYILSSEKVKKLLMDFEMFNRFNKRFYDAFIYPEGNYFMYNKSGKIGFKKIYKIGNVYVFIRNIKIPCKKVSRIQTPSYHDPKLEKIEYLGKGGNFLYTYNKYNKKYGELVMINKNNNFSTKKLYIKGKYQNYIYKDNGKTFVYIGYKRIIINPGIRIDIKNLGTVYLEGFYKNGFLVWADPKLIYVEIKNGKAILHTLIKKDKYSLFKGITISKDGQHYAIGINDTVYVDGKELNLKNLSIRKDYFARTIKNMLFYGKENKLAISYSIPNDYFGIYADGKEYLKQLPINKDSSYRCNADIYGLGYIDFLKKFIFFINQCRGDINLVILNKYSISLPNEKVKNYEFTANYFIDKKNKVLYTYYPIEKIGDLEGDGYISPIFRYGYFKIDLETLEKRNYKTFDGINNVKLSDEGDFGFTTKDGIFINGRKVIDTKGKIIKGFNFGKGNTFYYIKYEEKKHKNGKMNLFVNYECKY